jgi:hypothetical protein
MAHGDARKGKWRGNWRMEWVASTLTLPRNVVYPALLPLMRTPRLPAFDWTDAPADVYELVRFGERRNLVYALVPSRFKRSLPLFMKCCGRLFLNAWQQLESASEMCCFQVCSLTVTIQARHGRHLLNYAGSHNAASYVVFMLRVNFFWHTFCIQNCTDLHLWKFHNSVPVSLNYNTYTVLFFCYLSVSWADVNESRLFCFMFRRIPVVQLFNPPSCPSTAVISTCECSCLPWFRVPVGL